MIHNGQFPWTILQRLQDGVQGKPFIRKEARDGALGHAQVDCRVGCASDLIRQSGLAGECLSGVC